MSHLQILYLLVGVNRIDWLGGCLHPVRVLKSSSIFHHQDAINVGGEDGAPIVEIREWLDSEGNETDVDLNDLGKVDAT